MRPHLLDNTMLNGLRQMILNRSSDVLVVLTEWLLPSILSGMLKSDLSSFFNRCFGVVYSSLIHSFSASFHHLISMPNVLLIFDLSSTEKCGRVAGTG